MSQPLRQSTQRVVRIGPFVDVGDGFTPETGVAVSTADEAEALKAAGAATADISGATWAAISSCDGWYDLTLTTSHTDTVGDLTIVVQDDSVCLPVHVNFTVLEEAVYDFLYVAGATPLADINAEVDTALTDIGLDHLLAASVTGTDVTDDSIIASLVSSQATADWDDFVNTTDAFQALRDNTGTAGAGLTAVVWNAAWDAEVQSEVADALIAIGLDHLISASVTGTDVADNSIVADLVSKEATADYDDYVNTTDSLQAQRDNTGSAVGADLSADIAAIEAQTDDIGAAGAGLTAVAGIVWDAVRTSYRVAGSMGEGFQGVVTGIVDNTSFVATTTQLQSDTAGLDATDDHYNGRVIIFFDDGSVSDVADQATDITDYDGTNKRFTYTALTNAPSDNHRWIMI